MQLLAFRVQNFRSVKDSGWIDVDQVTGLIGTNESGKTNILLPLWKLRPANGGEIDTMADYPRSQFHNLRARGQKTVFITARFEMGAEQKKRVAKELNIVEEERVAQVVVSRDFSGELNLFFSSSNEDPTQGIRKALEAAQQRMYSQEEPVPAEMEAAIEDAITATKGGAPPAAVRETLQNVDGLTDSKDSVPMTILTQLLQQLDTLLRLVLVPPAVKKRVVDALPSFVYYSNYGNIDSQIYLPHVIDNLQRTDLGQKEQAQVRTLRVLFDFVKISPEEIRAMGKDVSNASLEEIDRIGRLKTEREILLASTAKTSVTPR